MKFRPNPESTLPGFIGKIDSPKSDRWTVHIRSINLSDGGMIVEFENDQEDALHWIQIDPDGSISYRETIPEDDEDYS